MSQSPLINSKLASGSVNANSEETLKARTSENAVSISSRMPYSNPGQLRWMSMPWVPAIPDFLQTSFMGVLYPVVQHRETTFLPGL